MLKNVTTIENNYVEMASRNPFDKKSFIMNLKEIFG